ncbi:MAG: hypothetical protein J2P25_18775 [Nocardiopsaceae bacterium]|nr:hypothetical protein [Nocardiopsaceae bacterium]
MCTESHRCNLYVVDLIFGVPLLVIDLAVGLLLVASACREAWFAVRGTRAVTLTGTWRTMVKGTPMILVLGAAGAGMIAAPVWHFTGTHHRLQGPVSYDSFLLAIAAGLAYYVYDRFALLLRWRRMIRTDGKVLRFDRHAPGVGSRGGLLISFETADGTEEFWIPARTAPADVGGTLTISYDPDKPGTSATVQNARDVGVHAVVGTLFLAAVIAAGVVLASPL